jgi:integrase
VCGIVLAKGDRDSAFLIHVLAATGMRCGELYALRPEQFDDRGLSLRPSQTKTKHGRWVPLPPEAVTRLRAIIAAGKLPHRAHLYRIFKSAIELLGESSAYTLHCLRHTCVTRLLQRGVQKLDVGVLVGHRDKSVTSGYYHPSREHLTEQAKKAHNLLGEWLERAETAQAQVVDFAKAVEATAGIEPASTVLQTEKQYNHT